MKSGFAVFVSALAFTAACAPAATSQPAPKTATNAVVAPPRATIRRGARRRRPKPAKPPAPPAPPKIELPRGGRTLFPDFRLMGLLRNAGRRARDGTALRQPSASDEEDREARRKVRGRSQVSARVRAHRRRRARPARRGQQVAPPRADVGRRRLPRRGAGREGDPPAEHPAGALGLHHRGEVLRKVPQGARRRPRARSRVADARQPEARHLLRPDDGRGRQRGRRLPFRAHQSRRSP